MSTIAFTSEVFDRLLCGPMKNHELKTMGAYQPNVALYAIRQNGWKIENDYLADKTVIHHLDGKRSGYKHEDPANPWKATDWPGKDEGYPLPKIITQKREAKAIAESIQHRYNTPRQPVSPAKARPRCVECYYQKNGGVPGFGSLVMGSCVDCGKYTKVVIA